MNRNRGRLLAGIVSVGVSMMVAAIASAGDSVVIVGGDTSAGFNQPGWLFNRDASTSTPIQFNTDESSAGLGSLFVEPIGSDPADKFVGEYFYLDSVDGFESFSYDFLISGSGGSADAVQFYLNVYTNLPGSPVTGFYDCRFDYVPASGSASNFTTFYVDPATVATNVRSRNGASCPGSISGLPAGSSIRAFSINLGDTSPSDTGLAGYFDSVVVSSDSTSTLFDFEPLIGPPTDKSECKNGGWAEFNNPSFRNQGDCVSYVVSNGRNR